MPLPPGFPQGTELDVLGQLDEPPFCNQGIEHELHERIDELRERVEQADGLLIAIPEYNYGVPAVFGSVRAQLALRQNLLGADARPMAERKYVLSRAKSAFDIDGEMIDDASSDLLIKFPAAFSAQITA